MKVTALLTVLVGASTASTFLQKQVNLAPDSGLSTTIDTSDGEYFEGVIDELFAPTNVTLTIANGPDADCLTDSMKMCAPEVGGPPEYPRCVTHLLHYVKVPRINKGSVCKTIAGTRSAVDETCSSERCSEGKLLHSEPYCIGGFTKAVCTKNATGDCVFNKTFKIIRQAYGRGEPCPFEHNYVEQIGFCSYDACK